MLIVGLLAIAFIGLGGLIALLFWHNYLAKRRLEEHRRFLDETKWVTLKLLVPKENEKPPESAQAFFASLHGILRETPEIQEHLSFEIRAEEGAVTFYVRVPEQLRDFLESQVYAQYPTVEITEVEDYLSQNEPTDRATLGAELILNKDSVYPIKTFENFEVDPLSAITAVLSRVTAGEELLIQYLLRPIPDEWQKHGLLVVKNIKFGTKPPDYSLKGFVSAFGKFLIDLLNAILSPPKPSKDGGGKKKEEGGKPEDKLSGPVKEALTGVETKIVQLGYETKIRLLALAPSPEGARRKLEGLVGAFKQYNTLNMNGFKAKSFTVDDKVFYEACRLRAFPDTGLPPERLAKDGGVLNVTELASLWHLPNLTVTTPSLVWAGSKKGEPPSNLPLVGVFPEAELTVLGETDFRGAKRRFGSLLDDRRRHVYIVGKTGVGKSVLLANMALSDIQGGHGVAVVDPHGDLIEEILRRIPDERKDDVILFDPSDREFPIAFNPLEAVEEDFKGLIASGFVGVFKKIFGQSWGPRLEHILRNTVLALLDNTDQTMLGIPKMLTDKKYRDAMVKQVKDPVIKDFWINEFAQYDVKFRTEAASPILNKVGQFLSTSTSRNILGQPKSSFNLRQIMDQRKILLVNLTRGKVGEDIAALLGAMMITKIQLAAMSRADIPRESDRIDFFLYVDEFQNFATESFATILSEARKYRLALTMANQYIAQMEEPVRDAVFGNVGTLIAFRVGAQDTDYLTKEFAPVFEENDLVNLAKFHIYIKLMIDGVASPAFSATTLPLEEVETGNDTEIRAHTRKDFARPRDEVESQIMEWAMSTVGEPTGPELALQSLKVITEGESAGVGERAAATLITESPESDRGKTSEVKGSQTSEVEERPIPTSEVKIPDTSEVKERAVFNPADLVKPQIETEKTIGKAVIGKRIYREISAKGGDKWYHGAVLTEEEKEKLQKKLGPRRKVSPIAPERAGESTEGTSANKGDERGTPIARIRPGESAKVDPSEPEDK